MKLLRTLLAGLAVLAMTSGAQAMPEWPCAHRGWQSLESGVTQLPVVVTHPDGTTTATQRSNAVTFAIWRVNPFLGGLQPLPHLFQVFVVPVTDQGAAADPYLQVRLDGFGLERQGPGKLDDFTRVSATVVDLAPQPRTVHYRVVLCYR